MKVYFAHSFGDGSSVQPLQRAGDQLTRNFLRALREIGVVVVDPADAFTTLDEPDQRFDFCLKHIAESQAVVVDARNRLGLGVGAELMFAHHRGIRVYAILPARSYYRGVRLNGKASVHAILSGLATDIFDSFDECLVAIKELEAKGGDDA